MLEDARLRKVIDKMALYVLDGGCAFEQAVMERVRGNPLFSFLFELGSKEHTYYVWRLYSFAQGDTMHRWRTEPFIMITGSGRWVPPALPKDKSPENEETGATFAAGRSRRVETERTLTDAQRDEFEDMLRALTLERIQIKEAMGFALDNADAAGEIVEVLTESLTLKETPIPTKVARLMLVSDILHNSSAPVKNASAYRTKFETNLPDILESFNDLYRSVTGRITAEALKERVMKVLQVWADWFLFSDAYVNGLRSTFLRSSNSGVTSFHSISGDATEIEHVLIPNVPDITVVMLEDARLRKVIDKMALYVLDGGCAFEQAVMERVRGNPLFSLLFELGSKEHTYYVWRLYSFAQGELNLL
ncbi:CID domain-containing protein [Artemisia annua]|uniref:CID domain-containing protein n=1 Tax=Artemisia annua TaxID=35608 RepID=A0A2U1MLD4_ARTAN|nr:CID domain-containing protein [Artemisia annua]